MKIHGREVHFKRTIEANCRVIETLAGGDETRMSDLFSGNYSQSQTAVATFLEIMSQAYEDALVYDDPSHEPKPLSKKEAMTLTNGEFNKAFGEALSAWNGEKPTVETEPKRGKKTEKESP